MSALTELQDAISTVAHAVGPAVVGIGSRLRGSGVIVASGTVLTNAHNVRGDEVTITFSDGHSTRSSLAGLDVDGDLAVITVDTGDAPSIGWDQGDGPGVGSVVFSGAATPGGGTRVTFGVVSAVARAFRGPGGRRISGSIEHTAPAAPGSSGGPLVNADGLLVGLNTNRLGEGFYLALPADPGLRVRVDALARGESVERPRLGVIVAPGHVARRLRRSVGLPDRAGILVRDVEDDGLAARAGIREGDLLVAAAGRALAEADDLHEALGSAPMPIEIVLVRGAEEMTVTVGHTAA